MNLLANTELTELLNTVPSPMAIAEPIYNESDLVDLKLVWISKKLEVRSPAASFVGLALSQVFPNLLHSPLLADLMQAKDTKESVPILRVPLPESPDSSDLYWITFTWWHEVLILTIEFLSMPVRSRAEAMRAASVIVQLQPSVPMLIGVREEDNWIRLSTERFAELLGWTNDAQEVFHIENYTHPDDLVKLRRWLSLEMDKRRNPIVLRLLSTDGQARWCELWMHEIPDHQTNPDGDFLLIRDVHTEVLLQNENARLSVLFEDELQNVKAALDASNEGFAIWRAIRNDDEKIMTFVLDYMNEAGAAPTGKRPDQLEKRRIEDVLDEQNYKDLFRVFCRALETGEQQTEIVEINSETGWVGSYEDRVAPFLNDRIVASFRDVSNEQKERQRLDWVAHHDHLTGIANRAGLEDYLQKALKSCRDEDNQIAFIFIDIDDFKTVNDTLGHGAGDRLLQSFVTRVSQSLPESAFLARISGDEFAIVLTEISGVVSVHNELQKLFQVLTQEFNHEHPPICITVSAGCAISNGRIEISELMRASDREMYRAKHAGKNRYYIVDLDTVSFED